MSAKVALIVLACAVLTPAARADECTRQCKAETASCITARCEGLLGAARHRCRETCRGLGGCASIRTLAYVVTECRTDARGSALHQTLKIRRGNCAPTTVLELPFGEPVPDGLGLCRLYGESSAGVTSVLAGAFQRLGVGPGGSSVVFEITTDVTLLPPLISVPPELEGMYHVQADGSGLRRIGPASRYQRWLAFRVPGGPLLGLAPYVNPHLAFSPNGKVIVFTDYGPGPSGEDAPQVFTLDLTTGTRTQLTHLAVAPDLPESIGAVSLGSPTFLDAETVIFSSTVDLPGEAPRPVVEPRAFAVGADGKRLQLLAQPTAIPGARVDPTFTIAGGGPSQAVTIGFPDGSVELFLRSRNGNLLQLTRFGSSDLRPEAVTPSGRRIFFITSADPLGKNPSHNCQVFSIDSLASGLRQLTNFREVDAATSGCDFTLPRSGCGVSTTFFDAVTHEVVFYSSCDPFGTGSANGQMFAMRPDGSRLRQLTRTRGLVIHPDGTVTAELPGPFKYSGSE